MSNKYELHEYAEIFPPMADDAFEELVKDIGANGLIEPITLYEGKILDGRNRYNGCIKTGVEPHFVEFTGTPAEALAFVLSKNLKRRHLNESQRAMVAARLANMGEGRPKNSANLQSISQANAANMLNVAPRSTASGKKVLEKGTPELVKAVESGTVKVSVAEKIADFSREEQKKILEDKRPDAAVKKHKRAAREIELADKIAALPDDRYGVIYADPPWSFSTYSENGMDRSADNHYPTQEISEICELAVPRIAADDCALFLWTTAPMLLQALEVMKAWGFEYKTHFIWNKDKIGTGYWNRNKHEILLLGIKGNIPAPAQGEQWESLHFAHTGKHSEKPEIFYEMIEEYFPNMPKIELYSRCVRNGWASWGNEAQSEEVKAAE